MSTVTGRRAGPSPAAGDVAATLPAPQSSWEDLYDNAPCGQLSTTPEGVIVLVNTTLLSWTGYAREQLVGSPVDQLLTVGSRLFYQTRGLPVLRLQGELREVALQISRADGSVLSVVASFALARSADGAELAIRLAVFDSTARGDYERELLAARRNAERSEVRVRVLQRASAGLATARTEQALLQFVAETTRAAFDATRTAVLMVPPEGGALEVVIGRHPMPGPVDLQAPRPEAEALRRGEVVTIASLDEAEQTFPDMVEPLHAARVEALTATPMMHDDGPLGVVVSFFGRSRTFDDDERRLHQAIARQAAEALQRVRLQEQLRFQATHDQLTGLVNRSFLYARLRQVLAAAARSRHSTAVLFLDLDGFKLINDRLGHLVGDRVLLQVAGRLRETTRLGETVARFGGDEFVILCESADAPGGEAVADRIRAAIRRPLDEAPGFGVTASVGVAVHLAADGAAADPEDLVRMADDAMYRSKSQGRDRVTVVCL